MKVKFTPKQTKKIRKDLAEQKEAKKYRKKPLVVEAIEWTGGNMYKIHEFSECSDDFIFLSDGTISILTPEGVMTVREGDYIIKGIAGEFYSCRARIFRKSYEEIK